LDSLVPGAFSFSLDPAIGALAIGCCSLLFGAAASHKLRDMVEFGAVFAAYEILPVWVRSRLYWTIPLVEMGVAIGLLAPATRRCAAAVGIGLLIAYSMAIGLNLRAGRTAIACGCGGFGQKSPIAVWMVWRNLGLAMFFGLALLPWATRRVELTDAVTVVFGLAALSALYASTERLLGRPESTLGGSLRGSP
jgi:hypothetical protein